MTTARELEDEERAMALVNTLSVKQREYLPAIHWLFYGPRAAGRTYTLCVIALLQILNSDREDETASVIDHVEARGYNHYIPDMLLYLAASVGLKVKVYKIRENIWGVARSKEGEI